MYAVTDEGYRAIASAEDALPGEHVMAEIPASTLMNIELRIARSKRNSLLRSCDWTQMADAPVDTQAWRVYRQALRDLPQQAGFPDLPWPTPPNLPNGAGSETGEQS